jgi:hypothetical protein
MADMDFEIEIRSGVGREYELSVIRSPAGEARQRMVFPFEELALQVRLQALEIALLRSGGVRRRLGTNEERTVEEFGGDLFDALISGEVRSRFDASRMEAQRAGKALRVKLRFDSPAMSSLPWEFMFDDRRGEYLVLSTNTPLVRYIELPDPIEPLAVAPPLRMLALVASPNNLPQLDGERERLRVHAATKDLQERGLLEVHWLEGATWRDLQNALRRGRWNIFHFVGHGGFDPSTDEGVVALVDEGGGMFRIAGIELARLLGDHYPLRLAVLNACEGARGSNHDLFSSTAATLVRRGTPAVVAMQYEITDQAAIEFSRSFYEAIADGLPVDHAMAESRKSVSVAINNTLEWGTPVLFMRSSDGALFRIRRPRRPLPRPSSETIAPKAADVSAGDSEAADALQPPAKGSVPDAPRPVAAQTSPAISLPAVEAPTFEAIAQSSGVQGPLMEPETISEVATGRSPEDLPIESSPTASRAEVPAASSTSISSGSSIGHITNGSPGGMDSVVPPIVSTTGRSSEVAKRPMAPGARLRSGGLIVVAVIALGGMAVAWQLGAGPLGRTAEIPPSLGPTASPQRTPIPTQIPTPKPPSELDSNELLGLGQALISPLGKYKLQLTPKGDLVLTRTTAATVWVAGRDPAKPGHYASMQGSDGNFVLYTQLDLPTWASGTIDHPGAALYVLDNGNVVVKDLDGIPLWESKYDRGCRRAQPECSSTVKYN